MELMNDLPTSLPGWNAVFKQEASLASAIDALRLSYIPDNNENTNSSFVLPGRKLEFAEVQKLLKPSSEKAKYKCPDEALKESIEARKCLLQKVENILSEINKSAETGDIPKLELRNQRMWSNCIYDLDRVTLKSFNDAKRTKLCYSATEDKMRFNIIVFVLTKVHELLMKNLTVTRRELFYQNVTRFRNQANLDIAVRDVCCLLESPPWDLGIMATAKGLVAGALSIVCRDGSIVDCMTTGGTLIPQDVNGIKEFRSTAKYVLVVEKDAVFQKLLDEGALVRLGPVIIITGKGYPDICTRFLLCRLCKELRLRALALVDADPHGIEIFLTYKYGSLAQSHLSETLACPSLSLLGARQCDVMTLASTEVRMRITETDKRKLTSLLARPYLNTATGAQIKQELSAMMESGVKAEIEAVAPTTAALCDAYLPAKIIQGEFLG